MIEEFVDIRYIEDGEYPNELVLNRPVKDLVEVIEPSIDDVEAATSLATPNTIVKRGSGGRFQSAAPSVAADVANKGYVDTTFSEAIPDATHPVVQSLKRANLCFPFSLSGVSRSPLGTSLTGASKWSGGVLGTNGKIFTIPFNSTDIMIIDPITGSASMMGVNFTGSSKWAGGVLAPDGKIYGIPYNSEDVLVIDPLSETATLMGVSLTGSGKWYGGVVGSNGKIYCAPFNSVNPLVIDVFNNTAIVSTSNTFSGSSKWQGGVLGTNGSVYFIPYDATTVLKVDSDGDWSTIPTALSGNGKWSGGALGPDGKIYGIPYTSSDVLIFDTINETATRGPITLPPATPAAARWRGGVVGSDGKIYCIPATAPDVLVINPFSNLAPSGIGENLPLIMSGLPVGQKWFGGVLGVDGKIYGVPSSDETVLMIENKVAPPLTTDLLLSAHLNKF